MDCISYLNDRLASLSLDAYEIYAIESSHFSAEAKEGQIDFVEESLERGVAVRLFKSGRCGFGCSSDWTPDTLEKMLQLSHQGLFLVQSGTSFELPASFSYKHGRVPIKKDVNRDEKLQAALQLEQEARNYDPRVSRVRDVRYEGQIKRVFLRNSRGLDLQDTLGRHEISLMVVAEDHGEQQMAWESQFSTDFSRLSPKKVGEAAAEKAVSQLSARPISTRKTASVLDSVVAASFLGVLSSSFLGDQVLKNRSSLRDRQGESIYSSCINLIDDGSLEEGYESLPFDGEGVPTRRNVLVERGVLKKFLYDSSTAAQAGSVSTGNSVRPHFKETPRVGTTHFYIEPGHKKLADLLNEMGTGFWIRDVIGVHTADPVTGDFSLGASGIWVVNGKRHFPVRGVTVSGNLHSLLRMTERVGSELRFYQSFGSPPLLVSSLDIGGL